MTPLVYWAGDAYMRDAEGEWVEVHHGDTTHDKGDES